MGACPSAEQIRLLLGEALDAAAARAVAEHVNACDRCLEVLDRLSMEGPGSDGAATVAPSVRPPRVAGYVIQEVLGRGGMGVVYRAWQLSLGRPVALKVIDDGPAATPERRQRFRQEAEALARLQHPNIVQVYDVGEADDGSPFLVLELVDGPTLAQYAAEAPLPARAAAALVATLADAMHHAHDRGVLHRDLTPANILLQTGACPGSTDEGGDGLRSAVGPLDPGSDSREAVAGPSGSRASYPVLPLGPKIADFGLAKVLEFPLVQTAPSTVLGTPGYLAPEQAAETPQTCDRRTDVYALGAVLYRLLTGRPPFVGASPMETLLRVRSCDPVAPRHLQPAVPPDLETVCLACLHKDPAWRYESAAALAADLRRFLAGRPVQARPLRWTERLWLASKRRPAVASLVVALAVVLGCALAVTTSLWRLAVQERGRAIEQAGQLRASWEEAQAARATAEEIRDIATRLVLEFLHQCQSEEGNHVHAAHLSRMQPWLEAWRQRYRQQVQAGTADRQAREMLATAERILAQAQAEAGQAEQALQSSLQAVALLRQLASEDPGAPHRLGALADAQFHLGSCYACLGRRPQAVAALAEAAQVYVALANQDPNLTWRQQVVECRLRLAQALAANGNPSAAEELYRTLRSDLEGLTEASPQDLDLRQMLARTLLELRAYAQACDEARRVAAGRPTDHGAVCLLGYCLLEAARQRERPEDLREAIQVLDEGVAQLRRELARGAGPPRLLHALFRACNHLVQCHAAAGDRHAALATGREALDCLRELATRSPLGFGQSAEYMARLFDLAGSFTALRHEEEGLPLPPSPASSDAEALYAEGLDTRARSLRDQVFAARHRGDLAEAIRLTALLRQHGEALVRDRPTDWHGPRCLGEAWTQAAKNSWKTPCPTETLAKLRQAAHWDRRAFKLAPDEAETRMHLDNRLARLGRFLGEQRCWREAAALFPERAALWTREVGRLRQLANEVSILCAAFTEAHPAPSPEDQAFREQLLLLRRQIERRAAHRALAEVGLDAPDLAG